MVYLWCDGQIYLVELWRIYTPPFWKAATAEKAG